MTDDFAAKAVADYLVGGQMFILGVTLIRAMAPTANAADLEAVIDECLAEVGPYDRSDAATLAPDVVAGGTERARKRLEGIRETLKRHAARIN